LESFLSVLDGNNVRRSDDNSFIGVISENVCQVLSCLNENKEFETQAFCQLIREPLSGIHGHAKLLQSHEKHNLVLNVNIYGAPDLFDGLGVFLTDVDLFLQTPEFCDKNVEYRNPQMLTPVGSTPTMTLSLSINTIVNDGILVPGDDSINTSNLMVLLQDTPCLEETPSPVSLATELHRYLFHAQYL